MTEPKKPHPVTVFRSESAVTSPVKLVKAMVTDLVGSRQVARMLAFRDLKAQYRQSILGWIWLIIPPIAWTVGLTVLRKNNLADLGETQLYYPAYVLISMSMWQMFVAALRGPMGAFQMNRGLITKIRFAPEALVLADVIKLWVDIAVYLLLIAAAFVFYGLPLSPTVLLFPAAYLMLALLGTVLGLIIAPIGLLYRDIGNMLPYATMAGLAITPVIFPMPGPENDGVFATVVRLNPVTPLLVTARELVTGETLTQLPQFFAVSGLTVVGLIFGLTLLRASIPLVVERWSS